MAQRRFQTVDEFSSATSMAGAGTVAADLEGDLLRRRSTFPYLAVVAFEAGGVLRLIFLLLLTPLAWSLRRLDGRQDSPAATRVLIFAATAGAKLSSVESAARAVLPKFFSDDIRPEAWRVFSSSSSGNGRRCVMTVMPRVMVDPFAKEYLGAEMVLGTELRVFAGRATGFVRPPAVIVGERKAAALREAFGGKSPDLGLGGGGESDLPFLNLCKEGYVVPPASQGPSAMSGPTKELAKPVIFHDGRLVQAPATPLAALLTLLWIPFGILLAVLRIAAGALLPMRFVRVAFRSLGVRVTVRGVPPPPPSNDRPGVLFVCSHRTLLDPIFLSVALRRPVAAVTYSVSRLSELLSPIKTVRLARDRAADSAMIKDLLKEGDLVICPEGTTCREPFLLRFSAMFAELTDDIVPVAVSCRTGMFHGTTARGWKAMDPFFFFMNPSPLYELTFLNKLPPELTCGGGGAVAREEGGGGRTSHQVANYIQRLIAATLSYETTGFTRKDKYLALAGNNGVVPAPAKRVASKAAARSWASWVARFALAARPEGNR